MTSSTNEKEIKRRRDRQSADRANDKIIIRGIMSTDTGRGWVWRWLAKAHLFREDENLNPYVMAFQKGERNYALQLLKDVQSFCPADYIRMVNENTGADIEADAPQPAETEDTDA